MEELKGFQKAKAPWNLTHDSVSCPGCEEEDEYIADYTEEGTILKKTGKKINIQNKIQAYAEDCDLSIILKNLLDSGIDITKGVTFTDDIVDYTPIQDASIQDMIRAQQNYEKNLAYYEAELKKMREEMQKNSQVTEEGGQTNE